jgi:hypothetical protein
VPQLELVHDEGRLPDSHVSVDEVAVARRAALVVRLEQRTVHLACTELPEIPGERPAPSDVFETTVWWPVPDAVNDTPSEPTSDDVTLCSQKPSP